MGRRPKAGLFANFTAWLLGFGVALAACSGDVSVHGDVGPSADGAGDIPAAVDGPRADGAPSDAAVFDGSGPGDQALGDQAPNDQRLADQTAPKPDVCSPTKEVCNGLDDDCDGKVDEGLATDKGTFAGCKNYRTLINTAVALMDADAKADGLIYRWKSSGREEGGDRAAFGLLARTELLLSLAGVALPLGTRQRLIDQAIAQAEGFMLWEVSKPKAKAVRSAAGITHSCRGFYGAATKPTVGMYYTGPILLAMELLARVIYEAKLGGSYKSKADSYHALVLQVIDHWLDAAGSHFKTKSTSIAGIGKANWVCMEEPSASCTLTGGARAVKWNVTTFFWRAVGVWNDVDNKHHGSTTTYRRIRVARFIMQMKQDMLDSSGAWSNTKPYVWHSWADAPSSYPYIEDASHGAWDVGLMFEAWRGGWKDELGKPIMGIGSASRFRRTYLDNLAIANNPCVGMFTDGSQQIVGHKYYGLQLKTGRRRVLGEWVGMANKDVAYLEELYEDITGACQGYVPTSWAQHAVLAYARFLREIRTIRGE
jgi:hypothetical protein